jgi:hypothetical protein
MSTVADSDAFYLLELKLHRLVGSLSNQPCAACLLLVNAEGRKRSLRLSASSLSLSGEILPQGVSYPRSVRG